MIPKSLRTWFIIHFFADIIFGFPLLLFPSTVLGLFGLPVEQITARLVGAALIGIGGTSLLVKKEGIESYKVMLKLKIIWSSSAIIGLVLSLIYGAPKIIWIFLAIFAIFSLAWWRYWFLVSRR